MPYQVVPLRLDEHREDLFRLWRRNFKGPWMDDCAVRRAAWLYRENPFGPTRTWLAVETWRDQAVGCGSLMPLHRCIGGRVVKVGVPIDFAVDQAHRTAGAALALQQALTRESRSAGFECVIGKPKRKALPICARAGYQPIGESTEWVKMLDPRPDSPFVPDASYRDDIVNTADRRFSELWNRSRGQYRTVGEKTAAYLHWRYLAFGEMGYQVFSLFHRADQRLAGFVVFCRMETGIFIAELFSDDFAGGGLEELLLRFAARMQVEGREWIALSYLGAPSFKDRLQQLGFARRNRLHMVLAYLDEACAADVYDGIFDLDSSLMFGGEMDIF